MRDMLKTFQSRFHATNEVLPCFTTSE